MVRGLFGNENENSVPRISIINKPFFCHFPTIFSGLGFRCFNVKLKMENGKWQISFQLKTLPVKYLWSASTVNRQQLRMLTTHDRPWSGWVIWREIGAWPRFSPRFSSLTPLLRYAKIREISAKFNGFHLLYFYWYYCKVSLGRSWE